MSRSIFFNPRTLRVLSSSILIEGNVYLSRGFCTGGFQFAGCKWRKANMLPPNYNEYGPLTDLPDYSFKDGTAAPPGSCKIRKFQKHKAFAERIIELTNEVDFAVKRHERLKTEILDKEARILERKLKPKSADILKKSTS